MMLNHHKKPHAIVLRGKSKLTMAENICKRSGPKSKLHGHGFGSRYKAFLITDFKVDHI